MIVIKIVGVIVFVLLSVAFFTVAERKYMSSIQRRRGPNVIGVYGILQAFADGLKLIVKENTKPIGADSILYNMSPIVIFIVSISCWSMLPVGEGMVISDISIGVMYILGISSIAVYGVIIGGYSSNSKYGFYGGIRSSVQMISYEVSIGFIIGIVAMRVGGVMNMTEIVIEQERCWNMIGLLPVFIMFIISVVAETNRHPFDLVEAESELVSGYNVEYSGGGFTLFFLGEYSSIILMSSMVTIMFLGGWRGIFGINSVIMYSIKTFIIMCMFIWLRAAYPRYRYDQLIDIGWKRLLPISLGWLMLEIGIYSIV